MSAYSDFFSAGGGGLTPKFQEFTASGDFTPTAALISAGGFSQVFAVGGGQRGVSANVGGCGGEVKEVYTTLTSATSCTVTIGAGGASSNGAAGGDTTFAGSSAGGRDVVAEGGDGGNAPTIKTSGAGGAYELSTTTVNPGASVTAPGATTYISTPDDGNQNGQADQGFVFANFPYDQAYTRYAYSSRYAYASRYAYSNRSTYSAAAGPGYMGYGAGGRPTSGGSGISTPVANSGAGSAQGIDAASGIVIVKWFE